ncbi:MAG: 2-oxoacid:acceptor oxidoreductase family protein [Candidatus Helarchaeota archaeon]|nr:2-oxoacid:acceptor oxidoreductase family protein [Candidatus Helarchaeota archaeon]
MLNKTNYLCSNSIKIIPIISIITYGRFQIPRKKGQKLYDILATQIAGEEFKFPVVANVTMFGAIVAIIKLISRESAKKTVESSVPKKALEINLKALARGFQSLMSS